MHLDKHSRDQQLLFTLVDVKSACRMLGKKETVDFFNWTVKFHHRFDDGGEK